MKKLSRCTLALIFVAITSVHSYAPPLTTHILKPLILPFPEVPEAPEHIQQFINKYGKIIVETGVKTGVPPSVTIAQAIQESGGGISKLAEAANNLFGVKCRRACKKPNHCLEFSDDHDDDRFKIYPSITAAIMAHARILTRYRYKNFVSMYGMDWRKWADGLQRKGYATDRRYASKLKQIIIKYHLDEYDKYASQQGFNTEAARPGPYGWR